MKKALIVFTDHKHFALLILLVLSPVGVYAYISPKLLSIDLWRLKIVSLKILSTYLASIQYPLKLKATVFEELGTGFEKFESFVTAATVFFYQVFFQNLGRHN